MTTDAEDKAKVIALPPLIVAAALAIGFALQALFPIAPFPREAAFWLGAFLFVGAVAIMLSAARELFNARTPLDVRKPTVRIVESGIFAYSRNPIYLSMTLAFLAIAALCDSLWLFALAPLVVLVLRNGVIAPEERYLEDKFGEDYLRYKRRVRRWL